LGEFPSARLAFGTLYGFLNGSYAAVIRDDRCESMVVMKSQDCPSNSKERPPGVIPTSGQAASRSGRGLMAPKVRLMAPKSP
jgi:hypothetical protein